MKNFDLFFWNVSRAIFTPLLAVSLTVLGTLLTSRPADFLYTYTSYPLMMETILAGLVLYLAFSVLLLKIHLASLHEGRD